MRGHADSELPGRLCRKGTWIILGWQQTSEKAGKRMQECKSRHRMHRLNRSAGVNSLGLSSLIYCHAVGHQSGKVPGTPPSSCAMLKPVREPRCFSLGVSWFLEREREMEGVRRFFCV